MGKKIVIFILIILAIIIPNNKANAYEEKINEQKETILEIKPGETYEILSKVGRTEVYFQGQEDTSGIEASWNNRHYSSIAINEDFEFMLNDSDMRGLIKNTGKKNKTIKIIYDGVIDIKKTDKKVYEKITLKKNQTLNYKAIKRNYLYIKCNIGGEEKAPYDTISYYDYGNAGNLLPVIDVRRGSDGLASHLMQGLSRVSFTNINEEDLAVYINHSKEYEYKILDTPLIEEVKLYRGEKYELNLDKVLEITNTMDKSMEYSFQYVVKEDNWDIFSGLSEGNSISWRQKFYGYNQIANTSRKYDTLLIPTELKGELKKSRKPVFVTRNIAQGNTFTLKNDTDKELVYLDSNSTQFVVGANTTVDVKSTGGEYNIQWELIYGDREVEEEDVSIDGEVDIVDLSVLALSYGEKTGNDYYNPNEDIVRDGIIDIYDLVRVSKRV